MRRKVVFISIAVLTMLALASTSAFGQCSMCRTALAGSNNALFIRNFNIGVLVLLVPPVTIFCSIFLVLRRYKNEPSAGSADFEDVDPREDIDGTET